MPFSQKVNPLLSKSCSELSGVEQVRCALNLDLNLNIIQGKFIYGKCLFLFLFFHIYLLMM